MWKLIKSLCFVMLIILVLATLAIFYVCTAEANVQAGTGWAVVFKFKAKPLNEAPDPEIRIHLLVQGATEGEAAIAAHKAIAEKLTAQSADRLEFVEAQKKN